MLAFSGPATKITPAEVSAIAAEAGVAYPLVRAVMQVESAGGGGFLPDKRPEILFEAQHFHSHTGGKFDASHPSLSSPVWNRKLYAGSGAGEYDRLNAALALDRTAALLSASWGAFQIMGENFHSAGFADVEAFVLAMTQSEAAHLRAFLAFIRAEKILPYLTALDWAGFALRYNGPEYAANSYDKKLADAYYTALRAATVPSVADDADVVDAAPPAAPMASVTLNARSGPGVLNPTVPGSPLAKGQVVTILRTDPNGWAEVAWSAADQAYSGWVNLHFLA